MSIAGCLPARGGHLAKLGLAKDPPITAVSSSTRLADNRADVSYLGCSNQAVGNPGRTGRDPWRPHSHLGHIEDEAAGHDVDRRRRHSFGFDWRDRRSACVWRAGSSTEKNPVPLFVWPEFPAVGHMEQGDPQ